MHADAATHRFQSIFTTATHARTEHALRSLRASHAALAREYQDASSKLSKLMSSMTSLVWTDSGATELVVSRIEALELMLVEQEGVNAQMQRLLDVTDCLAPVLQVAQVRSAGRLSGAPCCAC